MENLRGTTTDFNYRLMLARIAKRRDLLPKTILFTKKSWMPGWLEHNPLDEIILSFNQVVTNKNSFCCSIFGQELSRVIDDECKQKNYRFLMGLFY